MVKLNTSEYKKNRSYMYQLLEPYMEQAISNAKKLANINKGKKASQSTPGTEVYRLIEKLLPYLK
ncbi:RloB domain-containing protein [Phascolarctobacterium succinatutens]|uniref:RloB domain-containing protein n=1 Tax=Phascolarctobacterium succinatutens TaxID=626940 RepID=UPI003C6E5F6E